MEDHDATTVENSRAAHLVYTHHQRRMDDTDYGGNKS